MALTDPPYNVDYKAKGAGTDYLNYEDKRSREEYGAFLFKAFKNMASATEDDAAFYVWFAFWNQVEMEMEKAGILPRQSLCWVKSHFVLGRSDYQWKHEECFYAWKYEKCIYGWKKPKSRITPKHYFVADRTHTTVLEYPAPASAAAMGHPDAKPVSMFAELIKNSSLPGETVIDFFLGSGTTLIACEETGRVCYGMEIEPKFCDTIIARWEKLTGKQAVKSKE